MVKIALLAEFSGESSPLFDPARAPRPLQMRAKRFQSDLRK
jgi:hypothetical protein